MNLTAGATLQNNKYVIRTLLSQSDWGMTYEAFHTYLECPVILQTLNPAMRQRSDFDELRQRFMAGVRQFIQLQGPGTSARVLDCFHEEEWPFVVLERTGEQALPNFLVLAPLAGAEATAPETNDTSHAAEDTAVSIADTIADTAAETATHSKSGSKANAMDVAAVVRAIAAKAAPAAERNHPQHQPENAPGNPDQLVVAATDSPQLASSSNALAPQEPLPQVVETSDPLMPLMPLRSVSLPLHSSTQVLPRMIMLPSSPRTKAWMPILLIASCIGGLLGIGLGLSLRLSLVRQTAEQPRLSPTLFSREQTFPGNSEWPVSEPPDYLGPQAVEQPVYRISPPLESYGDPLPLPSPTTFAPPSPLPEEPAPLDPVESVEPTVDLNQPSPLPSAAPSAPPPAAMTQPPDSAVPPPAAPVAPPPPLVPPPAVEPSPPEPAPRTAPPPMVIRQ